MWGDKSGDNANHRRIGIRQMALLQQRFAAVLLALNLGGAVVLGNVGVCFRIVAHHVNAVENAHNAVLPPHQCPIHAIGIPRVENLLGVGGADGGDTVGGFDGALHQVDHAVKFQ